jgi:hypothetical protein
MRAPQQIAQQPGRWEKSMATSIQPNVSATKHEQIIEAIAKETEVSIERVREIYETERSRLDADARVKTYVSVIATRLVKNALQPKQ